MKKEVYIQIRQKLNALIVGTEWENHVFCVGGCVRDEIMGNEIKDIDLVVDLPEGGIRFAEWMYENGAAKGKIITYPTYGTAMFRLKDFPSVELECVQTRKGKYPEAGPHSSEKAFGSLVEDCHLRDLTINALYRNISTDELLDITGKGIKDIDYKVIRTTTDPDIVFDDDALRILRCVRFATRYDWEIEQTTYDSILRNVPRLNSITPERIRDELDKMLVCSHPVRAMELLRVTRAMHYVIPEMEGIYLMKQNHYHFGTVWEHTMKVLENIGSDKLELRMAALLHDIGKLYTREETPEGKVHFIGHERASVELTEAIMRRLKYSNDTRRKIQFLVLHHMDAKSWEDDLSKMKSKHLRKLQYICKNEEVFKDLLLLIDADNKAHAEGYCLERQAMLILNKSEMMKEEGSSLFNYSLPFTGKDVMSLKKIKPGPEVKECLDYMLKLAYVNPLRSKEEWMKHLMGYPIKKKDDE